MKREDELNELEKIIENYDDIAETPPDYSVVMPTREESEFETFPVVSVKILPGLNSKESFFYSVDGVNKDGFANLNISLNNIGNIISKFKNSNNEMPTSQAVKVGKPRLNDEKDLVDMDDVEKFEMTKEKYQMDSRELVILQDKYYKLNIHLMHLFNQYEYIASNSNLNEKNKKIKLIEFIKEFQAQFHPKLKEFTEMKICSFYLNLIREELLKFIKLRYEMFYKYIVEVKGLIENLGDLNLSI